MARKEKNVTRAFEVTVCYAQTIRIAKKADESGSIPNPTVEPRTYTVLGTYSLTDVLPILRQEHEVHVSAYDRIIVNVDSIKHKWQLRAVPYSRFFAASELLSEAETFEQLRAKKDGEE